MVCEACDILVFFIFDHAEDGKETTSTDAPENNPQYTTVYVGNLASEVKKTIFLISVCCSVHLHLRVHKYTSHTQTLILFCHGCKSSTSLLWGMQ